MDQQNGERIDLNTVSVRELKQLPGMDRLLARRIILDRKLHGSFRSLADLARVEGVDAEFISNVSRFVNAAGADYTGVPAGLAFDRDQTEGAQHPDLTFFGSPEFLRGDVPLRNHGSSPFQVTSLRIEGTELKTLHGSRLDRLQATFSIPPGQSVKLPVTIQLDPSTPPGVHKVELVAGTERWTASLHVAERTSASLAPSRFVLSNLPAAKTERQVAVRNEGNVPITIGDLGAVQVEDRDLICRAIRDAVKRLEDPPWDKFVGAVSDELKKSFAQIEPMRIRTKNKPVTIQPGGTAVLDLEIQNPKNVRKGRYYVARARLYNAIVGFELTPLSTEEEAS